jgi:hypothetical protein
MRARRSAGTVSNATTRLLRVVAITMLAAFACAGLAAKADASTYWAADSSVKKASTDGTGQTTFVASQAGYSIKSVAVDGQYVYWIQSSSGSPGSLIGRAKLDGSAVTQNLISLPGISGDAVKVNSQGIYWTDPTSTPKRIGRANLDGSNPNYFITVTTTPAADNRPHSLFVDETHIYWGNSSFGVGRIGRANIDGSDVRQEFVSIAAPGDTGSTQMWLTGIAVNGTHIYWTDLARNRIGRANLDGTGPNAVFMTNEADPHGMAVDDAYMYWGISTQVIRRASLDGTGPTDLITGAGSVADVVVDQVLPPPSATVSSPASNQTFSKDQAVTTAFSCAAGSRGPALQTCVDEHGEADGTGTLDTSAFGPHVYNVTATAVNNQTGTGTLSYRVANAPTASIASPADGQTYTRFQSVPTSFSCTDGSGGPGISTCRDSAESSSPGTLDTSTAGTHTYTVTATSSDGKTGTKQISYTVAAEPTASIATPVDGAYYAVGQAVGSSFTCTEGAGGPGIQSCLDSDGDPSGTALDTSSPGGRGISVTATSQNGQMGTASAGYTVAAAPTASIATPADNQTYAQGQVVATTFSCAEGTAGPGLASCKDSNDANGPNGALDTSTTGAKTYTITATSQDGQTRTRQISYTVAGAPSASVATPAAGAAYAQGQTIASSFSCADGASGPGIATCRDQDGRASGGAIDTAAPGPHDFTVTSTSTSGQTRTKQVLYTVAAGPSAAIFTPADNATFTQGQVVGVIFFCADGANGPGLASCKDSNGADAPNGALDTSTPGTRSYTVTATSSGGQTATKQISYTVNAASLIVPPPGGGTPTPPVTPSTPKPPSNVFTIGRAFNRTDGSVELPVSVPGGGTLVARDTQRKPLIGTVQARATRSTLITLRLKPNSAARKVLAKKGKLSVKVTLAFAPTGGKSASKTTTVVLKMKRAKSR